jgi:hypothetical protein
MLASLIRTLVPILVTLTGPWAAEWLGLSSGQVAAAAGALVGAVYYLLVRLAERYWSPRFGWLLGRAGAPVYAAPVAAAAGGPAGTDFDRIVREARQGRPGL